MVLHSSEVTHNLARSQRNPLLGGLLCADFARRSLSAADSIFDVSSEPGDTFLPTGLCKNPKNPDRATYYSILVHNQEGVNRSLPIARRNDSTRGPECDQFIAENHPFSNQQATETVYGCP